MYLSKLIDLKDPIKQIGGIPPKKNNNYWLAGGLLLLLAGCGSQTDPLGPLNPTNPDNDPPENNDIPVPDTLRSITLEAQDSGITSISSFDLEDIEAPHPTNTESLLKIQDYIDNSPTLINPYNQKPLITVVYRTPKAIVDQLREQLQSNDITVSAEELFAGMEIAAVNNGFINQAQAYLDQGKINNMQYNQLISPSELWETYGRRLATDSRYGINTTMKNREILLGVCRNYYETLLYSSSHVYNDATSVQGTDLPDNSLTSLEVSGDNDYYYIMSIQVNSDIHNTIYSQVVSKIVLY